MEGNSEKTSLKLIDEIVLTLKDRVKNFGLKGKKRDAEAVSFLCGAGKAIVILKGEDSSEWKHISLLALMTSIEGFKAIDEYKPVENL